MNRLIREKKYKILHELRKKHSLHYRKFLNVLGVSKDYGNIQIGTSKLVMHLIVTEDL